MKIKFTYGNNGSKTFYLEPYTSKQEKELILIQAYSPSITEENLDDALRICNFEGDISSLTLQEKILILWKYREISISENVSLKFQCPHCGTMCDNDVKITDLYIPAQEPSESVIDNYDGTGEVSLSDDADLNEYIQASKDIDKHIGHFDFTRPCMCVRCKKPVNVDLSKPEFVLDNMSEKSIQGIYDQYNSLVYFGHYSKLDIDSMYPFERDVLLGILQKTIEEINKAKTKKK